jgi:glutamate formiminotransferase
VGAIDVVPFVPLGPATMENAVNAAHRLGRALAERLAIPIFLYGEAAPNRERRLPAALRRQGLGTVAAALAAGSLVPDYGPSRAHPSAGVTLVGARGFLVAFNLRLATADLRIARDIARAVRERDGGLAGVQALGLWLESRQQAQVSLNLLRPDETPLDVVVERVRAEAAARGVDVDSGELIGLLPEAVARRTSAAALFLPELGERQILERRLTAALGA